MNKILLIGRSRDKYRAGSHYSYLQLKNYFSDKFDYIDGREYTSLDFPFLFSKYEKVIFCNQSHNKYPFKIPNKILLTERKMMMFTRFFNIAPIVNSITNGFSIYKERKVHKYFFPTITSQYYQYKTDKEPTEECFGYYYRPQTPDSFFYFMDMMNNYHHPVNIKICGREPDIEFIKRHISNINKISYTMDMREFFSEITHYIMPMSASYIDPLPHVIIEAVQHDKQVICPKLSNRNHKDGIDDVLSIIKYHTDLYDKSILDNTNTVLDIRNFENFYRHAIYDLSFEYKLEADKYNTFYEWCCDVL